MKRCGVCQHSQREVIEAASSEGDVPGVIAGAYGLRVLDVQAQAEGYSAPNTAPGGGE